MQSEDMFTQVKCSELGVCEALSTLHNRIVLTQLWLLSFSKSLFRTLANPIDSLPFPAANNPILRKKAKGEPFEVITR